MSSTNYGSVRLAEEERRRAAAERRLRKEAEQRRRAEEQRRRAEEERKRKAMERTEAAGLAAAARELRERLRSMESETTSSRSPVDSTRISSLSHRDDVERTRAGMLETITGLQAILTELPQELRILHHARLAGIERELDNITSRKDDNFTIHAPQLKWLRNDLFAIVERPDEQVARWARLAQEFNDIRLELERRSEELPRGPLSVSSAQLMRTISDLVELGDMDVAEKSLGAIETKYRALLDEIEREKARIDEHARVSELLTKALESMGYRATTLRSEALSETHPHDLYFDTPSGAAVRVQVDRDGRLRTEFIHIGNRDAELSSGDLEAATAQCREWCNDQTQLRERLRELGVDFELDRSLPPERGGFLVMGRDDFIAVRKRRERDRDGEYWNRRDRERTIE